MENHKLVERRILDLRSWGYIVEYRPTPNGWYYKVKEKKDIDNDAGHGIGYCEGKDGERDYFYMNSHGRNDKDIGNVWYKSRTPKIEGLGHYSFIQRDVINHINDLEMRSKEEEDEVDEFRKFESDGNVWDDGDVPCCSYCGESIDDVEYLYETPFSGGLVCHKKDCQQDLLNEILVHEVKEVDCDG